MSEIPLHTFGRSRQARAGYTPLSDGEPGEQVRDGSSDRMRAGVRAAASASANRKGKQRERYSDDPEEEATLLGDASHEDGNYGDDEPEESRREPSAQVCVPLMPVVSPAGDSAGLKAWLWLNRTKYPEVHPVTEGSFK